MAAPLIVGSPRSPVPCAVSWLLLATGLGMGCATPYDAPERQPEDRTPLTRACDDQDPGFCLMPWPSSAFTTSDEATVSGLRLEVDLTSVTGRDDSEALRRADGFSRVSSLVTSFEVALDEETLNEESFFLILAEPTHPERGERPRLRYEVLSDIGRDGSTRSVLIAHPLAPLAPNATYVAVVTDTLRAADGSPLRPSRATEVSLGTRSPRTQSEADLHGYHAPTRETLLEAEIDVERVVRAWDFTTRSENDPRRRLLLMREAALSAVANGAVEIEIDSVDDFETGDVASIVLGRLTGLPNFLVDRRLSIDAAGMPLVDGVRDAPFRVVIPRGTGDYRMLMFGHGTGGTVEDSSFDEAIAGAGAAKVNVEFYHWTELTVIDTFLDLQNLIDGANIASSGLMQAIADASAIQLAARTSLGDILAAEELMGAPNPHAGRRPDDSVPMWVGGSLGGTMGLLYAATHPDVRYAVLNVAGAAWGTWTRDAYQYSLLQTFIERGNGGPLSVAMMVSAAQTLLDEADGASYAEVLEAGEVVALVQQSVGDPVLPNPGTHFVARLLGASQVGEPLIPLEPLPRADSVVETSALTQFRVAATDPLERHGFANRSGPAGEAAREQIFSFIESAWAGSATVTVPSLCAGGSCAFAP